MVAPRKNLVFIEIYGNVSQELYRMVVVIVGNGLARSESSFVLIKGNELAIPILLIQGVPVL